MTPCDYCKHKCLPFAYAGTKNICRTCLYKKSEDVKKRIFLVGRAMMGGEE